MRSPLPHNPPPLNTHIHTLPAPLLPPSSLPKHFHCMQAKALPMPLTNACLCLAPFPPCACASWCYHGVTCYSDIKPENILLAGEWQAGCNCMIKVIDYGTSMFCTPGQRLTDKRGTPAYVAPEVCYPHLFEKHITQHLLGTHTTFPPYMLLALSCAPPCMAPHPLALLPVRCYKAHMFVPLHTHTENIMSTT